MTRRFITALDVQRSPDREIVVDDDTIVTPQALDVARSLGIVLKNANGPYQAPSPDRGPDAELARNHLPHLPEPVDPDSDGGTGIVVTAVGRNRPGVLAEITSRIAELGLSVEDISQKTVDRYFHLVLITNMAAGGEFDRIKTTLECSGVEDGYAVRVMHERVFGFMHRI